MLSLCRISAGNISCPFVETVVFMRSKITSYPAKVNTKSGCVSNCDAKERFILELDDSYTRSQSERCTTTSGRRFKSGNSAVPRPGPLIA
jgi:hypothetical protein